MSQQYPQQPQSQPGTPVQPPKKKHTVRNVFLAIGLTFVVLVGGCSALIAASGGDTASTATDGKAPLPNVVTSQSAPAAPKTPAPKPAGPSSSKPVDQAPAVACADHDDRNEPCVVQAGKPFVLGKHTVLAGWRVIDAGYGLSISGKAKNTGDSASSMIIDVKFLRGDEVLASVMCTSAGLEPGQTGAMNCLGDGEFTRKYDRITAEATL
jgi:hypothetical protein